jgi:hypothetical protein
MSLLLIANIAEQECCEIDPVVSANYAGYPGKVKKTACAQPHCA